MDVEQREGIDYPSLEPAAIDAGVREVIARAEAAMDRALAAPAGDPRDVLDRLDDVVRILAAGRGRFAHLRSVDPDPARRRAADRATDELERTRQALTSRPALAQGIAALAGTDDGLDPEASGALGRWRAEVRLTGEGLEPADRTALQAHRSRLLELSTAFLGRLNDAPRVEVDPTRLDGLAPDIRAGLPEGERPGTVVLELTDPLAIAVLEHVHDRGVRELVTRARHNRGGPANKADLAEAVACRRAIAGLLGEPSWAALRIADNMAGTPEAVERFLGDLVERLGPVERANVAAMARILRALPGMPPDAVVEDWDWQYLDHRQREAAGFDVDAFRDYLAVEDVLEGMVAAVGEVFGVRLASRRGVTTWHPDVRVYDLLDDATGSPLAVVLVDPFARDGKVNGAWVEILDPGARDGDPARPPVLALVANSTAPGSGDARLTPYDVETLFHEFGHVVHVALAQAHSRYALLADDWMLMDWIEAPSQFLGRWGTDPMILGRFARHRLTGERPPPALLEAFRRAERLNLALMRLRQAALSLFDLRIHGPEAMDLDEANRETSRVRSIPLPADTFFPGAIAHLMGGYDAGFYGYLWAEVLSDDLMAPFAASGMLAPAVGAGYRASILESPVLADPTPRVRQFLGREPSSDAFFARIAGAPGSAPQP